jgi:hypothetical protein
VPVQLVQSPAFGAAYIVMARGMHSTVNGVCPEFSPSILISESLMCVWGAQLHARAKQRKEEKE